MLWSRKRANAGPQNHLEGNWNSKWSLDPRENFAPSAFCVTQGVPKAGSSAHPTKKWDGKRKISIPTTAPQQEQNQDRRTRRFSHSLMENLPFPPARAGNAGEGSDPWYSQWVPPAALLEQLRESQSSSGGWDSTLQGLQDFLPVLHSFYKNRVLSFIFYLAKELQICSKRKTPNKMGFVPILLRNAAKTPKKSSLLVIHSSLFAY